MPQQAQQLPDIHDDPEFHQLPMAEKHKVLMAADPDYRGLPPSEQAKALDEIHYGNLGRDQTQFTGGTRNRIADAIDTGRGYAERGATRVMQNFGLPTNPDEARHFVGGDPGQKPALMEMIDAGRRALPVVGPAYQASDDIRAGKYPEAVGDIAAGVAGAAPFRTAGVSLSDAIGKMGRTPEGEVRAPIREGAGIGGGYVARKAGPVGAYVGYQAGKSLADAIIPDRAPEVRNTPFRMNTEGTDWTPESDNRSPQGSRAGTAPSLATQILRAPEPTQSSNVTMEQVPGKPSLRRLAEGGVEGAGAEYQRRGGQVLYTPKDAGYPPPRESTTFSSKGGGVRESSGGAGGRPDLRDAVSDTSKAGKASPVSKKGQNLPAEDRLEQLRRGAAGEDPASKSLRRKVEKRNTKLENRP